MSESSSESWARDLYSSKSGAVSALEHGPLSPSESPWLVRYELDPKRGTALRQRLPHRSWTLWRYRELLPLPPHSRPIVLGEGGTPLLPIRRLLHPHTEALLKDESGNPTGSFKARGLSLAVNMARQLGAPGVQLPSAGNAALAAAAYAAAVGLPCRIALPQDTPETIFTRCRQYGCQVLRGGRTLVEAGKRLTEGNSGYWDLSTFREPYRVEGKKTMGLELAEQLGWSLPDWIVYPTGGGTGIVALAKAIEELSRLGLVEGDSPRLVSVQMEGCAPIVEAFRRGDSRVEPWREPRTDVWGLRVPKTIADTLVLAALRSSSGRALSVSEEEVALMQESAAQCEGLLVGPEGAAALAAAKRLIDEGVVESGQRLVVFQTGHPGNYI